MKTKYLFVVLACIILFPTCIKAECTYARQANLSKIASNVQFSYNYEVINNEPKFYVDITNITNDVYVMDKYDHVITSDTSINYSQGQNIAFSIYSNDDNCKNEKLITQYVNIPNFNYLSLKDECKEYPNFKYCQMWTNVSGIDYDKFKSELDNYLSTKQINVKNKQSINDTIKTIIQENILIIILVFIAIVLLIVIKFIQKR